MVRPHIFVLAVCMEHNLLGFGCFLCEFVCRNKNIRSQKPFRMITKGRMCSRTTLPPLFYPFALRIHLEIKQISNNQSIHQLIELQLLGDAPIVLAYPPFFMFVTTTTSIYLFFFKGTCYKSENKALPGNRWTPSSELVLTPKPNIPKIPNPEILNAELSK